MSKQDENTVYLTCNVNEVYCSTECVQYFSNSLSNPIELSISIPIKQEIQFNKFKATIDKKIIISKVLEKEKAKEKYNDLISSGNSAFIGDYDDNEMCYDIVIGNLLPNQKVILETSFLQLLTSNDMSYEFSIMDSYPSFYYRKMDFNHSRKQNKKNIKGKININTLSKITRLISFFLDGKNKKNSSINFSDDYKNAIIEFKKNFDKNDSKEFENSFRILFRTEKMNIPKIYSQFYPEKNETSYICNFIYSSEQLIDIPIPEKPDLNKEISYYNKYQNKENDNPALFIFLIDQSGSMPGDPINIVKQSLLLFIKSLPVNSYFQLIGFGSNFRKYNNNPVEYNEENVNYIIEEINNLKADMGGTNISTPLKYIFKNNYYSKIELAKNIFLLTDGEVHDKEECFNLISQNDSKFRIHSIGIGNYFDKNLIEKCGKLGKGSSSFVYNIEDLNNIIIDILNKCLRPYLINIKFDINEIKKEYIMPFFDNISYQDDIINYAFISKEKNNGPININLKANDTKKTIEKNFKVEKIIKLENGNELSKIIINNILKKSNSINKEEKIKLSKEYQVFSGNTSLFGEIFNDSITTEKLIKVDLNIKSNNKVGIKYKRTSTKKFHSKFSLTKKKNVIFDSNYEINSGCDSFLLSSDNYFILKKRGRKTKSKNNPSSEDKEIKKKNDGKNKTNDFENILLSQDIIEGFWDKNNYTLEIKNKIYAIFKNIENFINKDNGVIDKNKAIYTILIIYYCLNNMKDKKNEFRLIINKGKNYLKKIGITYDNIISNF